MERPIEVDEQQAAFYTADDEPDRVGFVEDSSGVQSDRSQYDSSIPRSAETY